LLSLLHTGCAVFFGGGGLVSAETAAAKLIDSNTKQT
jgi:hypothetical protein